MTLKEKLETFKEKGWTYNKETGEVFSHTGKLITGKALGYINCGLQLNKKTFCVAAHQLGWYLTTGEVPQIIDHINRDITDNRLVNLRSVNRQQNAFNTDAKGYSWHKGSKKWAASIKVDNRAIFLGRFTNEADAHQAYLTAKEMLHKAA